MTASRDVRRAGRGHAGRRCAAAPRRSISASSTASRPSASPTSSASRASEAGAYIKTYFERFPGIRDYMDAHAPHRCAPTAMSTTLFGRKIHFPQPTLATRPSAPSPSAPRSTRPIQGTAADIIRRAMIRMEAALQGARLPRGCCCRCTTNWSSRRRRARSTPTCRSIAAGDGARRRTGGAALGAAQGRRQPATTGMPRAGPQSRSAGTGVGHGWRTEYAAGVPQVAKQLSGWLAKHHQSATGLWVRIFKAGAGTPSVTWTDCVLEAIRFGWIDGQKKKPLDAESYLQRLAPRQPKSNWSAKNCAHATRLIAERSDDRCRSGAG